MDDIPGFQCTNCGKCCLEGASQLQANEDDIVLWEEHAPQLLDFVTIRGEPDMRTGNLWPGQNAQKPTRRCRWIKKFPGRDEYYCRIYEWRPTVCRNYPTSLEHARFTDCPGAPEEDS